MNRDNEALYDFFTHLDRASFINNKYSSYADIDAALPIGHEQTVSQPSLVYTMTDLLALNKSLTVLEIGTGSGYQTAFLARFAKHVYTIELIPELSEEAHERLTDMGYQNITFRIGDGSKGIPEFAPYERIIVTAGAGSIPDPLLEQLQPGGRMVIPVGPKEVQELLLIEKDPTGQTTSRTVDRVRFVEFVGEYGYQGPAH